MEITEMLFEHAVPVIAELQKYGFRFEDGEYVFRKDLPDAGMYIIVKINGGISASMHEIENDEEYIPVRLSSRTGGFVSEMREEYGNLLKDIRETCFRKIRCHSFQALRILRRMIILYPEHRSYPYGQGDAFVFSSKGSRFASVILHREEDTLQCYTDQEGAPDDPAVSRRKRTDGIFEMTITLNNGVSDEAVMEAVQKSSEMNLPWRVLNVNSWVIPANPSYFDLEHAFSKSDVLYWHQNTSIAVNDRIFIYYGAPYSEILYECRAEECGMILEGDAFDERKHKRHMRIRMIRKFEGHVLKRKFLEGYGLKAVRGARRMPEELAEVIDGMFDEGGKVK